MTTANPSNSLLTPEEAAAYLRLKPHTLATWRSTGRHGLPYIKAGKNYVRYRLADLIAWESAHLEACD